MQESWILYVSKLLMLTEYFQMIMFIRPDSNPSTLTCLQSGYDFTPIASQRQRIGKNETGAYGAVIYSLKSNVAIRNISDVRGKRFGVAQPLAVAGFQLGWQVEVLKSNFKGDQATHSFSRPMCAVSCRPWNQLVRGFLAGGNPCSISGTAAESIAHGFQSV